ncbi:tRNA (N(6)-L-threonylcarbamoyladenosine(37)-C(2))-methylthiotransferase [Methanobrevibacter filiformis]|uniref:tRNA-t(6)A37 methylthiotransferase n=1 Tax=Methanobrevibacter filiformis TaxID=55758 RepID=A0A166CK02_9EURY|nr:tRNA (N(6)-L-threonylcarbamoyladenosine(37)-C(2))-methylthiotransferase [Methanobrevibacter filiformis]KZX14590.1 tRNA-2-methylthio-N(6)-dimethylallyladenosine synthase [Methanobrevibacter filiformis]
MVLIDKKEHICKVFIETYGCTFNKADSEIIAGYLVDNGVALVDSIEKSDIAIINTCYVKNPTESKITNRIGKLQKNYPEVKIIVSGCMVEIDPEKLSKIAPNASWIGPHKLDSSFEVVKNTLNGVIQRECGFSSNPKVGLPKIRFDPLIHVIQICEGCLGACTYCCTRFARGYLQSYKSEDIMAEARQAIREGCVEIQLTAQDTAAYGKDTGEKLSDLINDVASIEGNFRVRVGMMHPKNAMDDIDNLIESFKLENVYSFVHLPIQSGSNKILNDMGREHTVEQYKNMVKKFKKEIPNITIATDIIVGYPTESEEDFNKTVDLIEEIKPGIIHLSKYKHRKGALSSIFDEIPHNIMKKRSKHVNDIKSEITKEENKSLVGTIQKALVVEVGSKSGFIAKTDSYIPVVIQEAELGTFVEVEITEATSTYLKGKVKN